LEEQQVNQIFTQLLYSNLPDENIQYPHWFQCCIILDKKILKDYLLIYQQNIKIGIFYQMIIQIMLILQYLHMVVKLVK